MAEDTPRTRKTSEAAKAGTLYTRRFRLAERVVHLKARSKQVAATFVQKIKRAQDDLLAANKTLVAYEERLGINDPKDSDGG